MSHHYRYPEFVNDSTTITPELIVLLEDAMNDLRARRNRKLLWQAPATVLILLSHLWIFGVNCWLPLGFYLMIAGMMVQGMTTSYDYTVSSDRTAAKFHLKYRLSIRRFLDVPFSLIRYGKTGILEFLIAVAGLIFLPIWWPLISVILCLEFFNNIWFLKGFEEWLAGMKNGTQGNDSRQHVRGTEILPSVQLAGTAPNLLPEDPLEVVGGKVTLLPDGGIVIEGGAAFDRNSTFGNFSVNGVTLTRESQAMLKVSHEGSEHSFKFDGNSWAEV